ncbi:MAG: triphosphoribosyl-dephospho-CoA synthase CitG [Ruminococcaceae bacterium]|nr:triphosphoribosyl-dephospho-CoA synthase CitG [Oscillospiraceae bacterium]
MNTNKIFDIVSELARKALIDEVSATPKPGLVDSDNSGAHNDMDINTFIKSADSLFPYFYRFTEYGYNTADVSESESFPDARVIGIEAEDAMYKATGGVNTHKGIIFSAGLVCMAVGRLYRLGEIINIENICLTVAKTVSGICVNDYSLINNDSQMSNGERIYKKYGIKGPRGEAESGFLTVRMFSYPFMKECFDKGIDKNTAMVRTLLYLMSIVDDTNVINRGGREMAEYVKIRSKSLYNADMEKIKEFDTELTEKRLSAGGCADLLAVTWLIYNLEQVFVNKKIL